MKRSNQSLLICLGLLSLFIGSCAPPPPPASSSPQSTPVPADPAADGTAKKGEAAEADTGPLDLGGADIGTDIEKTGLKACLAKGMFYNRGAAKAADGCSTFPVLKKSCTQNAMSTTLNKAQYASYQGALPGLAGYKLDQCLDCTSPANVSKCSILPKVQDKPGVRLFFVKYSDETKPTLGIKSQSLYLVQ